MFDKRCWSGLTMVDANGRLVDDPKFVGPWGFSCFIIQGIHTVYMCLDLLPPKSPNMYISLYIHILYRHILDTVSTTLYIMDCMGHTAFPQSNMALGNPHICHEQKPSVKISHRYWLHHKYGGVYGTSTNIWRFPEMVPKSSIYSAISPKSPILIAGWWFGTWFLFFH